MTISPTTKKAARIGYLMGQGWSARRIANDPEISTTPMAVYKRAAEYGLGFNSVRLIHPDLETQLDVAAVKRGTTKEDIWNRLICELRMFPALIDNILGDDDPPTEMNGVRPS